ncbi:MAG: head GIN domain-containing protein [bacterium]|nr:head GIN domain-containing protein [bacterium]
MKYLKLLLLLGLSGSVWAQKEVRLEKFTKIKLEAPVHVKLVSGNDSKATHSADLSGFNFTVKGGVLEVNLAPGMKAPEDVNINLYYTQLEEIEVNGAGKIEMEEGELISGDKLVVLSNGAANVSLKLDLKEFELAGNGASKSTLVGKVDQAKIDLNGASKLLGANLKCKDLKVFATGASSFEVFCNNDLQINAQGASKGVYNGKPVNKKINVSGVAKIVDSNTGESMTDERVSNDDTTRITVGKKKFIIIENKDEEDTDKKDEKKGNKAKSYELKNVYAGFEIGMNQFVTPNLNFNMPNAYSFLDCKMEQSWFYGLNLLEGDLQIVKNKLAITTGLGMEFQNFSFNSNQILTPNVNVISADSGLVTLTKNKLYNYNLNVPLLIKFAPRGKKDRDNFHFAVGVIGSFKAYSHLRIETGANGYEQESKIKDDFNINPFRLTATARIGYGWFRAFANYSLTPYFNTQNNNPDIRVFSAGLTVIPF